MSTSQHQDSESQIRVSSSPPLSKITPNLIIATSVICVGSLQFGYHMAELNAPESILSCSKSVPGSIPYEDSWFGRSGYKQCLDLNSGNIGFVTSIFSIGGLIGSIQAGPISDALGRKKLALINCLIFILGSWLNTFANSYISLLLGRFIAGVGAGSALVVTPIFINEMSPPELRGLLGAMNQVSVNIGILLTQSLGLFWANDNQWRLLLFMGVVIGLLNFIVLFSIHESPKWLISKGYFSKAYISLYKLRGGTYTNARSEVESWAKPQGIPTSRSSPSPERISSDSSSLLQTESESLSVSFYKYMFSPKYRNSLLASGGILTLQQFCGINSIIFYGVSVLIGIFPNHAIIINCVISLANATITFLSALAIDRLGRKPLLLVSVSAMGIASAIMAVGIMHSNSVLSVVGTFVYVSSFAIGLGPIPFLVVSEFTQNEAKGVAQSFGISTNWISTFIVGCFFPIVKSSLGGKVYFIFTLMCGFTFWFIKTYIPETKGLDNYDDVWGINRNS